MRGSGFWIGFWRNRAVSIKEIVILIAILALGYYLGKTNALGAFMP